MIKSVPYFRHLDDEIIEEIVYLLKPHRYDKGSSVIKFGDITDKIHFLKQGELEVTIPKRAPDGGIIEEHFEFLNPGSCFCAFSAFSSELQQLVSFQAKVNCIVETIQVSQLEALERTYL